MVSGDVRALKVKQAKDRIDKLIAVEAMQTIESVPAMHELVRLIGELERSGEDEASAYAIDKLKRDARPKASPGKKSRRTKSGVG